MTQDNYSWRKLINRAPQESLSELKSRSIIYVDTIDDQPRQNHPDHKFRPMLIILNKDVPKLSFCQKLFDSLGAEEAPYAMYLIPLTTQHHPDTQPLHHSHVPVAWDQIDPNLQQSKTSYFDPKNIFALREQEIYDLEDHDQNLRHVPVLGRMSDDYFDQFLDQAVTQINKMELVLHPELKTRSLLQRLDWHDKYGSRGGENSLVASYKQQHPATRRFQRPALNQPPIKEPDNGPDL